MGGIHSSCHQLLKPFDSQALSGWLGEHGSVILVHHAWTAHAARGLVVIKVRARRKNIGTRDAMRLWTGRSPRTGRRYCALHPFPRPRARRSAVGGMAKKHAKAMFSNRLDVTLTHANAKEMR